MLKPFFSWKGLGILSFGAKNICIKSLKTYQKTFKKNMEMYIHICFDVCIFLVVSMFFGRVSTILYIYFLLQNLKFPNLSTKKKVSGFFGEV